MDDPGEWAEPWPYWKFGLKQNDLHESLHTKYNTILSAIQDPEAFHHDVYELSTRADTLSEFEQLMEERKTLRLKELNSMLEDASFQIVGCPRLIGTDQWPLAVQLFRTRSLDSLVRYFASYLPDEHPWYRDSDSADSGAASPISPVDYADYDGPILFDEPEEDEAFYTNEPSESFSTCGTAVDLTDLADQPARSNTLHSIDSGVSVTGRKQRKLGRNSQSASRTMSVSEPESDHMVGRLLDSVPTLHHDDATSQSDDSQTPSNSTTDVSESSAKARGQDALVTTIVDDEDADGFLSISHAHLQAMDTMDSDSPTPKAAAALSPAASATPLFETRLSPHRTRSHSSNRSHPHHAHHIHLAHQFPRIHATTRQLRRRDGSPEPERPRRAQRGRADRGREVTPEGTRARARARRRRAGA